MAARQRQTGLRNGPRGAAAPLTPAERDDAFQALQPPLLLAVSGGPDSLALLHLVADWASAHGVAGAPGVPAILVATVDHGLRAAAAAEARLVAAACAARGLAHVTLPARLEAAGAALQERARAARYDLLLAAARGDGSEPARQLVLAHHLDDQVETFLMRLARGSGVDGLSAMRADEAVIGLWPTQPVRYWRVAIHRPFLEIAKVRLVETLRQRGLAWCEDPSNEMTAFERVRWRKAASVLEGLGLSAPALAQAARRVGRARAALDAAADDAARRLVRLDAMATATLPAADFAQLARDVQLRLLRRLVDALGGQETPVRLSRAERLLDGLTGSPPGVPFRATIGGCLVTHRRAGSLVIGREVGRTVLAPVGLSPGQAVVWDRRFAVALARSARTDIVLSPLGRLGYAALKRVHRVLERDGPPSAVAATLPAASTVRAAPRGGLVVPHLAALVPELGVAHVVAEVTAAVTRRIYGDVVRPQPRSGRRAIEKLMR